MSLTMVLDEIFFLQKLREQKLFWVDFCLCAKTSLCTETRFEIEAQGSSEMANSLDK